MVAHIDEEALDLAGYHRTVLLDSVDSTNLYAQKILLDPDALRRMQLGELSLVATADQTSGRGRMNRIWTAPAGAALCISFVVRPHANPAVRLPAESYHWFTLLLALAATRTWESLGMQAGIKWPNDIMVGGKKACGILAQLVAEPDGHFSVVAGIGMNLNFESDDLPVPTATSALVETGQRVDLAVALNTLAAEFQRHYRGFASVQGDPSASYLGGGSLLDRVRDVMVTLGQRVRIHLPGDVIAHGVATDINAEGEIVVADESGKTTAYSVGDIVHLRPAS